MVGNEDPCLAVKNGDKVEIMRVCLSEENLRDNLWGPKREMKWRWREGQGRRAPSVPKAGPGQRARQSSGASGAQGMSGP